MEELSTVGFYLHWKWLDEEGGFNLIEIDDRRKAIEATFNQLLDGVPPSGTNNGYPQFPVRVLDAIWAKLERAN